MGRAVASRGVRRARGRERLLREASWVVVPDSVDVCVVGGGAAGLACAIAAAEHGARVVVLERDPECGRSILATGNGRCNFANAVLDYGLYNDPGFVRGVTGETWLEDVLGFFRDSGLLWVEESEGRLYPLSRQAASVRNVLLARARGAGVTLACARTTRDVVREGGGFDVLFEPAFDEKVMRSVRARTVVLATGGPADGQLDVGLRASPVQPVLCPLACTGPGLGALDGRRAHVRVDLERGRTAIASAYGEVLFRPYGLSGIVMFDLSRHARAGDVICLDLLPDVPRAEAERLAQLTPDGILDPAIAEVLIGVAGHLEGVVECAKNLAYEVTGPAETSRAQVTRGGLVTSQFDPRTLEARTLAGFYACGEALDVDGPCGGYNLAWAWKSGLVAGVAAAEKVRA